MMLTAMMVLVPALGFPNELMLQDTLKSAVAAFGILAAALVFVWQGRRDATPWVWHPMLWVPLALMVYAMGSMVWSHTFLAAVEAIRWFLFSVLLWVGLNTLNLHTLPKVIWGMHAGLVIASFWTVLQFWWDLRLFPQGPQPASTFLNRNFFAEYAVTVLPFSVWVLASIRNPRWLPWVAASVGLNVLAILMTGTRSALVALLILTPILAWVLYRYRRLWGAVATHRRGTTMALAALLLVILGGGSIPSGNAQVQREALGQTALERSVLRTSSIAKPAEYTTGSFSMRSTMWMATARMLQAQPLTGVGAGAWEVEIPRYQRVASMLENDYYAHNEYLQLLSEYGAVVGGVTLAFFLAFLLQAAGRTWRLAKAHSEEAALRAFTLCSMLGLLVVSNAGFPWHLAGCTCVLAFNLALLGSSDARLGFSPGLVRASRLPKQIRVQACAALLVCCIGLAACITLQAQRAEAYLVNALHLAVQFGRADQSGDRQAAESFKTRAMESARAGIAINPHYRRLTAEVAEAFAARGDWKNAVWILESVAASRPHVPAIWKALAEGFAQLGEHSQAERAYQEVRRLRPEAISTITLHANLLVKAGSPERAVTVLNHQLDTKAVDFEMVQAAYAIGYTTRNWRLAERALETYIAMWPDLAADGYFRLGQLYSDSPLKDEEKAASAFRSGWEKVPEKQQEHYRNQVPPPFRDQI
jgi:O-antigen ligase